MKMYQIDAFSQELFKGNPAAVIVRNDWLSDELMQNIAHENNLSETAFVNMRDAENFEIRWFTPTVEVDFCGHATLASAFVLFKDFTTAKNIRFHVKKLGIFEVSLAEDGKILMNFPIRLWAELITEIPTALRQALTQPFKAVYLNAQAYIVLYESVEAVLAESPNMELLKTLAQARTAISAEVSPLDVTITTTDEHYDCISRYFAPANGIDEDPVTGSIHTGIVPIWAEKLGKTELVAYQASKRGGTLYCRMLEHERIEISGYARLFMQAEINL